MNNDRDFILFLRWGLYCQSLALLFVLLLVWKFQMPKSWNETYLQEMLVANIVPLISLIGLVICAVSYCNFKYWKDGSGDAVTVEKIQEEDHEIVSFLMTTIVPLATVPIGGWRLIVTLIILLFALGRMVVDSRMLGTNPTLLILGYHLYKIEVAGGRSYLLISREHIEKGERIYYRKINRSLICGGVV